MAATGSVFRALSDPTRRAILDLLKKGPMASGDIAGHFPVQWATVSRHLGILREADLIRAERNGTTIRYELNTTVMQDVVRQIMTWTEDGGEDA